MAIFQIELTPEDLRTFDWHQIIRQSETKECHAYSRLLFRKARELEEAGDVKGHEICILLGIFTALELSPDTPNEPYRPALGSDIPLGHLDALQEVVVKIDHKANLLLLYKF